MWVQLAWFRLTICRIRDILMWSAVVWIYRHVKEPQIGSRPQFRSHVPAANKTTAILFVQDTDWQWSSCVQCSIHEFISHKCSHNSQTRWMFAISLPKTLIITSESSQSIFFKDWETLVLLRYAVYGCLWGLPSGQPLINWPYISCSHPLWKARGVDGWRKYGGDCLSMLCPVYNRWLSHQCHLAKLSACRWGPAEFNFSSGWFSRQWMLKITSLLAKKKLYHLFGSFL